MFLDDTSWYEGVRLVLSTFDLAVCSWALGKTHAGLMLWPAIARRREYARRRWLIIHDLVISIGFLVHAWLGTVTPEGPTSYTGFVGNCTIIYVLLGNAILVYYFVSSWSESEEILGGLPLLPPGDSDARTRQDPG